MLAILRMAHRCLGLKRDRLAIGVSTVGRRIVTASLIVSTILFGQLFVSQTVQAQALGGGLISGLTTTAISGLGCLLSGAGATLTNNIAIGCGAQATLAINALTIGAGSSAGGIAASALGYQASAIGANALALGSSATAGGSSTIAIGLSANASSLNDLAIGNGAAASGTYSLALGLSATTSGQYSLALGANALATNNNAIAIGASSVTSAAVSTAATTINGVSYSFAGNIANSVFSIGSGTLQRTLVNVAAGQLSAASTDAINGSQLFATNQSITAATTNLAGVLGAGAGYVGGVWTNPNYALSSINAAGTVSAASYTNVGTALSGLTSSLVNVNARAAAGLNISANGGTATNLGLGSTLNVANGSNVTVTQTGGTLTIASVAAPIFSGVVTATGGLSVGAGATVNLGGNKLLNILDGTLSAVSTDAVTGAQLFSTNQLLSSTTTSLSTALGGGANIGLGTAPSYTLANIAIGGGITNTAYSSVGGALTSVNSSLTNLNTNVTNVSTQVNNAVTNLTTGLLGPLQRVSGGNVLSLLDIAGNINSPGVAQRLTNLASGTLSAISTDAVTGSQLFTTNQLLSTATGRLSTALGGGANIDLGTAPSYSLANIALGGGITNTAYATVGGALTSVSGSLSNLNTNVGNVTTQVTNLGTQVNNTVTNLTEGLLGPLQRVGTGNVLTLLDVAGDITNPGAAQRLTNLASGTLSALSTDAVTGAQLFSTNQLLTTATGALSTALGGGANIGLGTGPSYSLANIAIGGGITNTLYTSVGGALTSVGGSLVNLNTNIGNVNTQVSNVVNNITSGVLGPIQRVAGGDVLSLLNVAGDINSPGAAQRLTNLASGTLSAISTDAVTGAQLFSTNQLLTSATGALSTALGGGANIGLGTGPNYSLANIAVGGGITSSLYTSVGGALTSVGGSLVNLNTNIGNVSTQVNNAITNITTGVLGPLQRVAGGDVLALVDIVGDINNPGVPQRLTNLAAGVVSSISTDAVTGAQLFNVNQVLASATSNISAFIGGGADIGIGQGPNFSLVNIGVNGAIGANVYNTVGAALTGLSGSLLNVGALVNTGLGVAVNGGLAINIGLGDTLNLASGQNIDISQNGSIVTIATVSAPTFSGTITANGGLTVGSGATVDLGGNKILNVAAGTLSAVSTDAVNGAQLYATNQTIVTTAGNISAALGGGANVSLGIAPSYSITNIAANGTLTTAAFTDVGSAFGGVNSSLTNLNTHVNDVSSQVTNIVNNITNGTTGPVQRTGVDALSLIASGGDAVTPGVAQRLSNVASGTLSAVSTDAVNGAQLYATNQTIVTTAGNISAALGGGADVSVGIAPSYSITNIAANGTLTTTAFADVGSAFGGVNSSLTNINTHVNDVGSQVMNIVNNITNGTTGPVQRTGEDALSLIAVGGDAVTPGVAQRLSNVASGTLAALSTDAVNGAQLYATNQTIVTTAGNISAALGGGADVSVGIVPSYTLSNIAIDGTLTSSIYTNVGSAFGGVNSSLTNINTHVNNVSTEVTNLANVVANIGSGGAGSAIQYTGLNELSLIAVGGNAAAPGVPQRLTNVAAGAVSAVSTDAVNGSQLYATNQTIVTTAGNISAALGGGADVSVGVAPSYSITNIAANGTLTTTAFSDVGSAFGGVNGSLTNLNTHVNDVGSQVTNIVNNITNGTTGPVQRTGVDVLLLIAAGGDAVTPGVAQRLSNVASGTLSAVSTDAVNGSQLYATNQTIVTTAGNISAALGGGANVSLGITPSYTLSSIAIDGTLTSNIYGDVGSAFGGVNSSLTNINTHVNNVSTEVTNLANSITNIGNGSVGPVQYTGTNELSLIASGGSAAAPGVAQKLTNVASGTLSAASTDAVNGSQLYATNQTIVTTAGNVSAALGGGADVSLGIAPSYSITNVAANGTLTTTAFSDVGSAFGGVNTSLTNLNIHVNDVSSEITNIANNISNGSVGPVQYTGANELSLIASGGSAAAPGVAQKLTNVASGTLSAVSTDAVNGSQLYATNQTIVTTAGNISAALGGGADVSVGIAPSYTLSSIAIDGTLTSSVYADVGSAFGGVNSSLTNINTHVNNVSTEVTNLANSITNIGNGSVGPVQYTGANELSLIASGGSAAAPGVAQKLTNVAGGTLSDVSTDAVNGAQLYATNQTAATTAGNISAALGGGADVNLGVAPSYSLSSVAIDGTLTSSVYNDVGSAFGGVNSSLTNINTHVNNVSTEVTNLTNNISNGTLGPVQLTGVNELSLIASGGSAAAPGVAQKLTNVASGTLSAVSTDAVNGSQLYATNQTAVTTAANISAALGGGADVNLGVAPSYALSSIAIDGTLTSSVYTDVGSAFGGVNTSLVNLNTHVNDVSTEVTNIANNISNGTLGPVQLTGVNELSLIASGGSAAAPGAVQKLTNVASGTLSAASTDAVNGAQLYATNQTAATTATNISAALGGGADVTLGTAPSYTLSSIAIDGTLTSSVYTDVGSAFGGVNTSLVNLNTHVNDVGIQVLNIETNISNGTTGPVQRSATNELSLIASGGSAVAPGVAQKLTNVASGTLSAASTDAVNGAQLYATNQTIVTTATNISAALGGGADISLGIAPSYTMSSIATNGTLTSSVFTDIGATFSTVNTSLTNLNTHVNDVGTQVTNIVNNISNGTTGPVQRVDQDVLALIEENGTAANPGTSQKLTNVAAGSISAGSTDAINGGQVFNISQSVASAIGGGATVMSNGQLSAPSFNIVNVDASGSSSFGFYTSVGDALITLSSSVSNINTRVTTLASSIPTGGGGTGDTIVQRIGGTNEVKVVAPGGTSSNPGSAQVVSNVASGEVSATSTDVVNGSQLYQTNQKVAEVDSSAVKYGKTSDGSKANAVVLEGGDPNAPVLVSNVATGVADTDAVNVAQLRSTTVSNTLYVDQRAQQTLQQANSYTDYRAQQTLQAANGYTDYRVSQLSQDIGNVRKEARQAAAIGLAAASLRYDDRPGKWSTAIGGGAWRGEGALAMGIGYTSEDNFVRFNISATTSGGNWGVGGGISFTLN
ncbi:YadA-like family protein [Microvirga sp. W0021]|uniref:YadA-like family protein n=1 Tax=Hohaiivirga grylli TaxID=3133970 RepID=A0ABV0BNI9_9HYPH